MIEALKEAFHEVAQLPEDEQRHILEIIRTYTSEIYISGIRALASTSK